MPTIHFRYAAPLVLCGLIAFLPFAGLGCMGVLGGPQEKKGGEQAGKQEAAESELNSPILRELDESLDVADDLESHERDEARGILREADTILTKIKEENREGLRRANNPPRRVVPQRPPEPEEDKEAKEDSSAAEQ